MSPDAQLLQAAHAGDAASFGLLLERYRPRLFAIALRMLGYGSQAEDAVQETFLTALRRLDTLADPEALQPWLDAIVRNICRMYRRRPRARSLDERPSGLDPAAPLEDPEALIEHHSLKEWVWKALEQLPEGIRATVILRHFGSFTAYEQIAEILAIPIGTVRSRLADGRRRLSERLLAGAREGDPHERRNRETWNRFYKDAFSRVYDGRRDEFISHYRKDMDVFAGRKHFPGRAKLEVEIDGDLESGTLTEPVQVYTSGNLSVLDCRITNPPENPTRCPQAMALVISRQGEFATKAYLYPGERLKQPTG